MNVKWLGHSCMKLSEGGWSAVCDPFFPGMVPGLSPVDETADAVFCSHEHDDHNYRAAVRISGSGMPPMTVTEIQTWHDDKQGALRGSNTVRVFTSPSGIRAVHLGDLGCELSDDQMEAIMRPDVLMIPVGGYYTIGPEQAKALCGRLSPRVVIPMHYRSDSFGFDVIGTVADFLRLFDPALVRRYDTNSLDVDSDTPSQIAVLLYCG